MRGCGLPQELHGFVAEFDGADDARRSRLQASRKLMCVETCTTLSRWPSEKHARVGGAAELSDVLGVTGELHAVEGDGFFVEGRGDHGVGFAMETHHCGVVHVAHGSSAVLSAHCADRDLGAERECVAVTDAENRGPAACGAQRPG